MSFNCLKIYRSAKVTPVRVRLLAKRIMLSRGSAPSNVRFSSVPLEKSKVPPVSETVPPLSPEVEDGAFQIAAEALTNIARHSDATVAVLRVYIDRSLHIEVLDNGTPDPSGWTEGFGMTSMRHRAAGAGGTLEAGPTPTGGRVCAELPLCPAIEGSSS